LANKWSALVAAAVDQLGWQVRWPVRWRPPCPGRLSQKTGALVNDQK
jgi:hypothetical protein